jgi:hypothetical protein
VSQSASQPVRKGGMEGSLCALSLRASRGHQMGPYYDRAYQTMTCLDRTKERMSTC